MRAAGRIALSLASIARRAHSRTLPAPPWRAPAGSAGGGADADRLAPGAPRRWRDLGRAGSASVERRAAAARSTREG